MFEFDLTFHNGPLATMKYTSTFSGNPFAGAGIELYNPNGSAGATLLSFEVTVEGDIFTIMDDNDYDTFPLVIIEDSIIDECH